MYSFHVLVIAMMYLTLHALLYKYVGMVQGIYTYLYKSENNEKCEPTIIYILRQTYITLALPSYPQKFT